MLSMIYFTTLFAFALMARSISSFPSTDRHGKMPRSWHNDNDMGPMTKFIQRDGPYESSISPQSNGGERTTPPPDGGVGVGGNLAGGVSGNAAAQADATAKAAANLAGQAGGVAGGLSASASGQASAGLHAGAGLAGSAANALPGAPGAGVGAAATHGSP